MDDAETRARRAERRAIQHELHILLLWLGRATTGWRLHRAVEEFWAAIEDRATAAGEVYRALLAKLPQDELKTLLRAVILRVVFGSLLVKVVLWSVPTIIVYLEFRDLHEHNRLLERQINDQVALGERSRDLEYLRILTCKGACEVAEVRRLAFESYLADQRKRQTANQGQPIVLHDVNLSSMVFDYRGLGSPLDLSNITFVNASFEDVDFVRVIARNVHFVRSHVGVRFIESNLSGASFDGSDLRHAKFDNVCLTQSDFTQAMNVDQNMFLSSVMTGGRFSPDFNPVLGSGKMLASRPVNVTDRSERLVDPCQLPYGKGL